MREIKFRAWDKENKAMFNAFGFDINTVYPWQRVSDSKIPIAPDRADCVLMQYTGIKDKNSKEIYEGDIVKTLDYVFAGKYKTTHRVIRYSDYGEYVANKLSLSRIFRSCEVIGNIYENPELLKEK